jgi:steroid delta-isomerase-like uncharacterized protein
MGQDFRGLAEQVYDIFTRGALGELSNVFEADFIEHEQIPGSDATGFAAVTDWVKTSKAAFPDISYKLESVVGSGNEAVCRVRMSGTHKGEFMGIPATGKPIDIQVIDWVRISDAGKVVEHWGAMQESELMTQLGVGPAASIDLTQPAGVAT